MYFWAGKLSSTPLPFIVLHSRADTKAVQTFHPDRRSPATSTTDQ